MVTIITIFVQKTWWLSTLNSVQAAIAASTSQEQMPHTAATLTANAVNLALQMHHTGCQGVLQTQEHRSII